MKKIYILWFIGVIFLLGISSLVVAGETINFTGFVVNPFESIDIAGYTPFCNNGASTFQWMPGVIGALGIRAAIPYANANQNDDRIFYSYNITKIILDYLTQQNGGIPPSEDVIANTTIYQAFFSLKLTHINASTFPNSDVGFAIDPGIILTLSRDNRSLNPSTAFSYIGIESPPRQTQGLENISFEIDPDLFLLGEKDILFFRTDSECDNI